MSGFVFSEKPITIERGDGPFLYDSSETEYLDAGVSYACTPVGHCHPAVVDAITEQAARLLYVQGSYPNAARADLYERLSALGPGDCSNVWLCNSGTEANEAALKFARSATGETKIVSTIRAFHGRTMGALAATWKREYKAPFEPLAADFEFVPYGDVDALLAEVDDETAGVIVEPIQGEGGIHPAPSGYLQAIRERADEVGAAVIFDEIQTGLGRTGTFWAADHDDVVPDIVTTAKGLASGVPIGATLCRDWIAASPGSHGSTFSGNPVACAAANATLSVIESEGLAEHARAVGDYLVDELTAADLPIRAIRGRGLMVGLEVKHGSNQLLKELALSHHILALPAGRSVLRLLPPLILSRTHVDRIVSSLVDVMDDSANEQDR